MDQNESGDSGDSFEDTYRPEQNRSLSQAVLQAIEEHKQEDLTKSDFVLYEDINPDALNNLFRHDAQPRTTVAFDTDDVRVELYGDDGVKMKISDREK